MIETSEETKRIIVGIKEENSICFQEISTKKHINLWHYQGVVLRTKLDLDLEDRSAMLFKVNNLLFHSIS